MKKAVFEVATLADAMAKANRIAPTKGAGFDLAAGIVIEVDPAKSLDQALIKATDLATNLRASISVVELGDEAATWRVPATLANGVVGNMPMGELVTLRENGDGYLYFMVGKTKARLRQITGEYPPIESYDASALAAVPHLAQRLQQVAWATDPKSLTALGGVHIDGERLVATNTKVLAAVPCKVPVSRPVTAPLREVAALLRNTSEVFLRAGDTRIELMPDEHTQTSTVIFTDPYPNVVWALSKNDFTMQAKIDRERLVDALERSLVLSTSERLPRTTITFSEGSMRLEMEAPDVGKIADEFDIDGGGPQSFTAIYTPDALKAALEASGRPVVTIDYGPDPRKDALRISDDNSYIALVMPRVESAS